MILRRSYCIRVFLYHLVKWSQYFVSLCGKLCHVPLSAITILDVHYI